MPGAARRPFQVAAGAQAGLRQFPAAASGRGRRIPTLLAGSLAHHRRSGRWGVEVRRILGFVFDSLVSVFVYFDLCACILLCTMHLL